MVKMMYSIPVGFVTKKNRELSSDTSFSHLYSGNIGTNRIRVSIYHDSTLVSVFTVENVKSGSASSGFF